MEKVYVVLGHTVEPPCEAWVVRVYTDEELAAEHVRKVSEEVSSIRDNIKRASMLRGKPFTQDQIRKFKDSIERDPQVRLDVDVTYEVVVSYL